MQPQGEVEIREVMNYLLLKKRIIIILTLVGFLLGVLIALTTPKKFEVKLSFLNEQNESSGFNRQGLAGLAGLAGVSFQDIGRSLNPAIYPEILASAPFVNKVGEIEFLTVSEEKMALLTYLQEHQKSSFISKVIKFPGYLISLFSGPEEKEESPGPQNVPNAEWIFVDQAYLALSTHLESSLEINNAGANIIEIVSTHQDPYIAGALAEFAYNFLTDYIAGYELDKESKKLDFTEQQLEKVKAQFLESQKKLAQFRDRNANIISAQVRSEQERLQADYNVAFNVYNALMVQREEAQLKLVGNIPAFTIIETVKIPLSPSWPNKKLIVVITVFASFFITVFSLIILFFVRRLQFI